MTSATERLRALLDERGVEWMPIAWNPKRETFYHTPDGVGFCADEYTDGVRIYTDATVTPEQAVAATLGPGTCRIIEAELNDEGYKLLTIEPYPDATSKDEWYGIMGVCSVCGEYVPKMGYCPNCGRKVVG